MSQRKPAFWIVRDDKGRLNGPLSTAQVLGGIESGQFQGNEMISSHPGGRWVAISSSPEFADPLLDALASEARSSQEREAAGRKNNSREEPEAESVLTEVVPPRDRRPSRNDGGQTKSETNVLPPPPPPLISSLTAGGSFTAGAPIPDLTNVTALSRSSKSNSLLIPGILIVAAIALVVGGLSMTPNRADNRFHLLTPRANRPAITEAEGVRIFSEGMQEFFSDTFSGYVRAQDRFVQAIEGLPEKPDAYLMLCMTYRELWPYASQDSRDLRAVSIVAAQARRVDPTGENGAGCEIVRLLLRGSFASAQAMADSLARNVEGAAPILEIQGTAALAAREPRAAQFFFESARAIWPKWLKVYIGEARAHAGQRDFQRAMEFLRAALKANSSHAVARIELGILEGREFAHHEKAIELLSEGLRKPDEVPRPVASEGYLVGAKAYLARGQKGSALDFAKRAYAMNASNEEARKLVVSLDGPRALAVSDSDSRDRLFLVDQYVQSGDFISAQAAARAAYEQDPTNAVAAMKAAENLWRLNQATDAIDWMKKAIVADPKLTLAYVELSRYYAERYDYLAALKTLQKIQSIQPRSHEVIRGFAAVELQRGNFEGAAKLGDRALQLYDNDPETFVIVAKAKLGQSNFTEAQKYAALAVEMDAGNAEARVIAAKALAGLRGPSAGIEAAKKLIIDYPYVLEYRLALAEIYLKEERFNDALGAFNEALSISKEKPNKRAVMGRGRTLAALGRNTDALEDFLQAAVLDPSDPQGVFAAGGVYLSLKKFDDAIRQYKRALRINPRYPRAHVQLGRVYLLTGQPDSAQEEAELERANNPTLHEAYALSAEAKYVLRDYSGCAQEYQRAVANGSGRTDTLVGMARCYRLSGSLDSAISILRQAEARESGGYPLLYKEYGAYYHTKCVVDEAVKSYNTYLSLAPGAADRREVEAARDRAAQGNCDLGGGG